MRPRAEVPTTGAPNGADLEGMHSTRLASHRDYSDSELSRAIGIATRRALAYPEGSDLHMAAEAIASTLRTERDRRMVGLVITRADVMAPR